ncbi:MAG: hypothetical protein J2P26_10715, partial [Nocardiopsaceae bacterium]|nr:hypothetical protein [Nocardiopsaceae bacterium]
MRDHGPDPDAVARHVTEFAEILTGLHGDRLDAWITAAGNEDDQPGLRTFAASSARWPSSTSRHPAPHSSCKKILVPWQYWGTTLTPRSSG